MKKKLLKKYLKALRSGEYRQTTDVLYSPPADAYCCLGVFCEVAGFYKADGSVSRNYFVPENIVGRDRESEMDTDFTPEVQEFYGFDKVIKVPKRWRASFADQNPGLDPTLHRVLIHMNDNGASFKRIARLIEKELG